MTRYRQKNSNNVRYRIGKKTLLLCMVIGIPTLIFILNFSLKNIEITGESQYTEDQIKDVILQSSLDHNTLLLYLKYRFFEKPQLPFVEKIEVKMKDKHSVTIYIYEKMVAGCVEFMGEYLYFDKDGIVVESTSKKLEHVPVIKGLKYNEIILNKKLNIQKDELFDTILNLTQMIEKNELEVDDITFSNGNKVSIDCGDITVLLGKRDTYDEPLAALKNMLKEAEGKKLILDLSNYSSDKHEYYAKPKNATE